MDREVFDQRLASLRETRARLPELVRNRHASRHRRPVAGHDGRLLLIEADGPAAANLAVGDDPTGSPTGASSCSAWSRRSSIRGVDGVIAVRRRHRRPPAARGARGPARHRLDEPWRTGRLGVRPREPVHRLRRGHGDPQPPRRRQDGPPHRPPRRRRRPAAIEACGHAVTGLAAGGVLALVAPSWCRRVGAGLEHRPVGGRPHPGGRRRVRAGRTLASSPGCSSRPSTSWPTSWRPRRCPRCSCWRRGGRRRPTPAGAPPVPGIRGMVVPGEMLYPPDGDVVARDRPSRRPGACAGLGGSRR